MMKPRLPAVWLNLALVLLVASAGSLGAQFQPPDWLDEELGKEVEALIGNVWDQRMARRTGMDVSMPLAEIENRFEVFARWVKALKEHGGELDKEIVDGLESAQASLKKAKQGVGSSASPPVDLDAIMVFLEEATLELQKASNLDTAPPDARGTSARPKPPPGAQASSAAARTDWPAFGGDRKNTKYSALAQIDRDNFEALEIAWRWTSISGEVTADNPKVKPGQFKVIPVVADGVLYVATEISQVAAIDPSSGKTLWQYDPEAWRAGRPANIGFQHRGVAHWKGQGSDGRETSRIFLATHDRKLLALDAKTGEPVGEFGDNGKADLLPERGQKHFGRTINWRHITHTSPVAVVGNTIIVGSIVHDGAIRQAAPPGHVRGFDTRTGELKWIFHTIPQEGEEGSETWENESWRYSGNTNVWSMMAVDDELGYVYLPVSTPTNDFYGGHRLGSNLFAESIVCLDADTGKKVWHFQAVHHGLWDYDFPTAPNLVDIEVDGKKIKALAQVSKQGFTYVFDRVTGEPVWPIEERSVGVSQVPGERSWPTQPFPTKPPAFELQGMTEENLIDLTPELKEKARAIVAAYTIGPLFTPPSEGKGTIQLPGAGGGANWPGAAVDPETGVLYVPSSTAPSVHPLSKPDPARSNLDYVGSFFDPTTGPSGLPLVKPPWGRVTAIDLNRGEHLWMTPNGVGPRSHPALRDLDLGMLGNGSGAPLLTKTLLFVTQRRGMGVENSARINVFDKQNGELLGHIPLPDTPHSNPVTYEHQGRQYLVLAVGGGPFFPVTEELEQESPEVAAVLRMQGRGTTPQLVAFSLPERASAGTGH